MNKMDSAKICAVTGAGGYVGSCVKNYFERRGWRVLELTRQPKPGARAAGFQLGAELSSRVLAGVDALVHCAYDFSPVRWADIHATNIGGTDKLLRAARDAAVKKIICISTISAFEGCRSLYGKAKLEIERLALAEGALVLRPGLVYGEEPGAMVGKLVEQVRRSSVLPLVGGSQKQYLVHQEDLCAFIHRYAEGLVPSIATPLTAAHEQARTFREILDAIAAVQGKKLRLVPVPWKLAWLPMKLGELCGMRLNFRSDSLVSLMHQNPSPDFSRNAALGLAFRLFDPTCLKM